MRRRSLDGAVRANSRAVLRPMPDEAPVMRTVLPARRFAAAEAMMVRIRGADGWIKLRGGVEEEGRRMKWERARMDSGRMYTTCSGG